MSYTSSIPIKLAASDSIYHDVALIPALYNSCKKGDIETVKYYIKIGTSIHADDGSPLLPVPLRPNPKIHNYTRCPICGKTNYGPWHKCLIVKDVIRFN